MQTMAMQGKNADVTNSITMDISGNASDLRAANVSPYEQDSLLKPQSSSKQVKVANIGSLPSEEQD